MRSMKKLMGGLLAVLLLCGFGLAGTALAESLTFSSIYGTVTIPSSYIILTRSNLSQHPETL